MKAKNNISMANRQAQRASVAFDDSGETCTLHLPARAQLSEALSLKIRKTTNLKILVDDCASAIIALTLAPDASPCTAEIVVQLGMNAACDLTMLHLPSLATCTVRQRSTLFDGARMTWRNVTLAPNVEHDLQSDVNGADAVSSIDWIFYAKGSERQALTVRNVFNGKNGAGEITMKGVAEEKGYVAAKGMIEIGAKGNGTNTYLTQNVLMLDKTAKVDAIPALEIKTNDVKASHSATVSRVTPGDLFYFGARGIESREAKKMYILGFLRELIERIGAVESRKRILEAVENKYGNVLAASSGRDTSDA